MTQECYENMSWSVSIQYLIHFQVVLVRTAGEKSNAPINNFSRIYITQVFFSEAVTIPGEILRELVSCSA